MALSVAPSQIRGSAVSVTACAQNSNNIVLTCTSNTDGSAPFGHHQCFGNQREPICEYLYRFRRRRGG